MDYEQKIGKRLVSVLSDSELYPYCLEAYTSALAGMGLSDSESHAKKVLTFLNNKKPLREREKEAWDYFGTLCEWQIF
ncbi:MAG: hypothetical protein WCV92_01705 [Candidatus Buchananbacteria bacterium]